MPAVAEQDDEPLLLPGMKPPQPHSAAPPDLRIGWILSGGRERASSRLQGYCIHEWMVRNGVASEIIADRCMAMDSAFSFRFVRSLWKLRRSNATHVIVESPTYIMDYLAAAARKWGKGVVAVRCDLHSGDYDENFDLTILPTQGLKEALRIRHAAVIDDMVEIPPSLHKTDYASSLPLKVAWVGHADYGPYITELVGALRQKPEIASRFSFELISRGAFATKQWSEGSVAKDILACDIALIAVPQGQWYANKSANRLAMMFSLAMPVVASPLPSYRAIGSQGTNVLFAESTEEIAAGLLSLQSEAERRRLGINARNALGNRYSPDHIGPQWLEAIRSVPHPSSAFPRTNRRLRILCAIVHAIAKASFLLPRNPGTPNRQESLLP